MKKINNKNYESILDEYNKEVIDNINDIITKKSNLFLNDIIINSESDKELQNINSIIKQFPIFKELQNQYLLVLNENKELKEKIKLHICETTTLRKTEEKKMINQSIDCYENFKTNNNYSANLEQEETDEDIDEEDEREQIHIYTDGASKGNPGDGGWGVLIIDETASPNIQKLFGGMKNVTNNQMELTAAIIALEYYKDNKNIKLYTDSKYVKDGITSWLENWKKNNWNTTKNKSVKNIELWKKLDELNKKHNITWKWVKGHSNNLKNYIADFLANEGIKQLNIKKVKEVRFMHGYSGLPFTCIPGDQEIEEEEWLHYKKKLLESMQRIYAQFHTEQDCEEEGEEEGEEGEESEEEGHEEGEEEGEEEKEEDEDEE